jgi:hypothetical protein
MHGPRRSRRIVSSFRKIIQKSSCTAIAEFRIYARTLNSPRKILPFGCAILALTGIFHPKPVAGQNDIPTLPAILKISHPQPVSGGQASENG